MATAQTEDLYSTEGEYGLKELANPSNPVADLVFVHGLTGNRETTWTHKANGTFWPRDLLPQDLPNVRIFTFGYDADVVRAIDTAGSETLRDQGKNLAHEFVMRRLKTRTNKRRVIFVAHSLGGLVVEQALLISRGSAQPYTKDLLRCTYGIIFIGTPHLGSSKANWASPLTRLSNVVRSTNKKIVDVLEPGSEMLVNVQQEFHTMLDDRAKNESKFMEIFCFYEVVPVKLIGFIVDQPSAVLSSYANKGIHANHMDMTKFTGSNDGGYRGVSDQLWVWVDAVQTEQEESETSARTSASVPLSKEELRDKRVQSHGQTEQVMTTINNPGNFTSKGNMYVGNIYRTGN